MAIDKSKNKEELKNLRPESVVEAYRQRLQVLRKAQEYSRSDEIPKAVQQYSIYLNTLARYFDIKEEELTPKLFNLERDITEMLLISQVYWDLAKAYDRSPKLAAEALRCLNQFAKFTIGFKYQYVNAQMLKKYIRARLPHNLKIFEATYEKVRVEGKGCYVASCLFGPLHWKTERLRHFRALTLARHGLGRDLIDFYELASPRLVHLSQNSTCSKYAFHLFFYPLVSLIVFALGRRYDRP